MVTRSWSKLFHSSFFWIPICRSASMSCFTPLGSCIHNDSRQLHLLSTGIIESTAQKLPCTHLTLFFLDGDEQHGPSCLSVLSKERQNV